MDNHGIPRLYHLHVFNCISLDHAHQEILPAEVGKDGLKYDSKFNASDGIYCSSHNYK